MEVNRSSNNKSNNISNEQIANNTAEGTDYISNLPEVILLYILSFLPLKEWIVVSLLSKQWKYLWTKVSTLNLDEVEIISHLTRKDSCSSGDIPSSGSSYQCLYHSVRAARRKFVELVDRILLLHSGCTMNTMRLSFLYDVHDGYTKRIDTWVRYALKSSIKELELNFCDEEHFKFFHEKGLVVRHTNPPQPYDLPHGLFEPKILETFILTSCNFRTSSFSAFSSLRKLYLKQVEVLDCSIEKITSKCPVLEDLNLEYCLIPDGFFISEEDIMIKRFSVIHCASNELLCIDISTPNLLMLTLIEEYLHAASIQKASNLVDVRIFLGVISVNNEYGDALNSLLRGLNHCKSLTLSTACIEVVPTEVILPPQLPVPLQKLNHLKLVVGISKKELPRLSCLLRSCPNLESLTLEFTGSVDIFGSNHQGIYNFEEYNYWESQSLPFPCLQNSLKEITVTGLIGRSNEEQIITFLLKNATVLEKGVFFLSQVFNYMCCSPPYIRSYKQQLSNLFNFTKASIQAEITIDEEPAITNIKCLYC